MSNNRLKYIRPENAINDPALIIPGTSVWYVFGYHDRKEPPTRFEIIKGPYKYEDAPWFSPPTPPDTLTGTLWFDCVIYHPGLSPYKTDKSLSDNSIGADYNNNYLFRTEEEAINWINTRDQHINPDYVPPTPIAHDDFLDLEDYEDSDDIRDSDPEEAY